MTQASRYLGTNADAVIAQIRSRDRDWFEQADSIAEYASDMMHRLQVHKGIVRELLASLLFQRVVTGFEALIILAERGMHTQGLVQRRSILEALFVLGAIWQQPSLANKFLLADKHRMLNIYKNVQRLSPEIQQSLAPELPIDVVKMKVAEFKSLTPGAKPMKIADYARAADLFDYYLTDYSFASEAAHHVAKDLERHIALDASGDVNGLYWGPEPEPPSELLSSAVDYVLMAVTATEGVFALPPGKQGEALRKRTNELIESST